MTVSVIYVNFNTTRLLLRSLRSLRYVMADLEVIVVDNASDREPLDDLLVEKEWPGAKVLRTPRNVGFGHGCNVGAEEASGSVLWLLNTDTILEPDNRIPDLIAWMGEHRNYGAVSPLLVDEDGVPQAAQVGRAPTLANVVAEKAASAVPTLKRWAVSYGDHSNRDVSDACAASLFVRADVFEQVGGFDTSYFFFLEDTDLCARLRTAGYRIRHFTDARVTHLEGGSVNDKLSRKRMYFKGLDTYFAQWRPGWERLAVRWMCAASLFALRIRLRAASESNGDGDSG